MALGQYSEAAKSLHKSIEKQQLLNLVSCKSGKSGDGVHASAANAANAPPAVSPEAVDAHVYAAALSMAQGDAHSGITLYVNSIFNLVS